MFFFGGGGAWQRVAVTINRIKSMAKRGLTKMGLGFRLGITCDLQIKSPPTTPYTPKNICKLFKHLIVKIKMATQTVLFVKKVNFLVNGIFFNKRSTSSKNILKPEPKGWYNFLSVKWIKYFYIISMFFFFFSITS